MFNVRCSLLVARCALCVVCLRVMCLFDERCLVHCVCCGLFVVFWLLFAALCVLIVGRCFGVGRLCISLCVLCDSNIVVVCCVSLYSLSFLCCRLSVARCLLFVVLLSEFASCGSTRVDGSLSSLFVVGCVLFVVCCRLLCVVGCCLLFGIVCRRLVLLFVCCVACCVWLFVIVCCIVWFVCCSV